MIFEKITVVHTVWYCYIAKRVNASVHWLRGNFWGGRVWKHTSNYMETYRLYLLYVANASVLYYSIEET